MMKKNITMPKHPFTLVLKNVDENTEGLEDSLYQVGCDDALINFRNGAVYLDFDRTAVSLEEAVLSAIRAVESCGAVVATVAPEDLVTESDIAKRLATNRQTVSLWTKGERRKSQSFPKPVMKLSERSPLWKWHEIVAWLYQNHVIKEIELVNNARFLENINAALDQRDESVTKTRNNLVKSLRGSNAMASIKGPSKPAKKNRS